LSGIFRRWFVCGRWFWRGGKLVLGLSLISGPLRNGRPSPPGLSLSRCRISCSRGRRRSSNLLPLPSHFAFIFRFRPSTARPRLVSRRLVRIRHSLYESSKTRGRGHDSVGPVWFAFIDRILPTRDSQLCSRPGVSPPLLNSDELSARGLYSIVAGSERRVRALNIARSLIC
jgi:hypothetical protein